MRTGRPRPGAALPSLSRPLDDCGEAIVGIPEPAGPLWAAVKAVYNPWPADDEGAAAEVSGAWRSANTVLAQGTEGAARAGAASLAAWRDAAGEQFHGRVGTFAADL